MYKQRMYCIDCGVFVFYTSADEPNPSESCPVNSDHNTRDHVVLEKPSTCEGFYDSAEDEQETSETVWQDALLIPVTPEEETIYKMFFSCELYNSNNNAVTSVRVIIDDVEYCIHQIDCEVDGGEKLEKLVNGLARVTLDASTHTIKVQFKARSGMAYIRRLRFIGEIVCYSRGAGYGYGGS